MRMYLYTILYLVPVSQFCIQFYVIEKCDSFKYQYFQNHVAQWLYASQFDIGGNDARNSPGIGKQPGWKSVTDTFTVFQR